MKRKRIWQKGFLFLLFCLWFAFPVYAAENAEEFYAEQYKLSGAEELTDNTPDSVKEYFEQNDIDPADSSWVEAFSVENVFTHIRAFLRDGMKTPLKSGAGVMGIILITAALSSLEQKNSAVKTAVYAAAIASAAAVAASLFGVIHAATDALKGVGTFMLSFVPVFAVIVAASGAAVTSVSMSALLLTAAQAVTTFSTFVVSPLMSGYLAVSISSAVSPMVKRSGVAEAIKKLALWLMGFISAVFVGVLGIQTAVNSSADTVSVKTAKFIIGSAVPVAGGVLSEALTTVTASMGLLRSSVGIYGVVVCLLTLLPLLMEILLWRVTLTVCAALSDLFALPQLSGILKAFDAVLSVLAGIILLVGAMFIICLAVVISAGRTAS